VTNGTVADCNQALFLTGLEAEAFFADKAYDTNELFDILEEADISAVIPRLKAGKNRERTIMNWNGMSLKPSSAPSSAGGEPLCKACRFLHRRHSYQVFVPLSSRSHHLEKANKESPQQAVGYQTLLEETNQK
jgi:IS5 family transposase